MTKPLFIPLKTEHFSNFVNGSKDTEYRLLGPRWNLKTCVLERQVILSCGYGKQKRLRGVIKGIKILKRSALNFKMQRSIGDIYRLSIGANPDIIAIEIWDLQEIKPTTDSMVD